MPKTSRDNEDEIVKFRPSQSGGKNSLGFKISIGKDRFYFGKPVLKAFKKPKSVILYYDRERRRVIFEFYPSKSRERFNLIEVAKSPNIIAKGFLEEYGLDPKRTLGRYPVEIDTFDGKTVAVISLPQ